MITMRTIVPKPINMGTPLVSARAGTCVPFASAVLAVLSGARTGGNWTVR